MRPDLVTLRRLGFIVVQSEGLRGGGRCTPARDTAAGHHDHEMRIVRQRRSTSAGDRADRGCGSDRSDGAEPQRTILTRLRNRRLLEAGLLRQPLALPGYGT